MYKVSPHTIFTTKDTNSSRVKVEGVHAIFLNEISKRCNFSILFTHDPKTPGYGSLQKDGTWTGVIGELVEERADIAPAMIPRVERLPYIAFTTWITINSMVLCAKVSDPMSPKMHVKSKLLDPIIGIILIAYFIILIFSFTQIM